jgi:signal transduction histidine kinase
MIFGYTSPMNPAFWVLRALNLAAALAVAKLGAPQARLGGAAAAVAVLVVAEGVLCWRASPFGEKRQADAFAASILETFLLAALALTAPLAAGAFDLAFLLPAVLAAVEGGTRLGGILGLAVTLPSLYMLTHGATSIDAAFVPLALVRGSFFVLVPIAAGLAASRGRSRAAGAGRDAVSGLRAAQVAEYMAYLFFQLRDYVISVGSLTESLALTSQSDPIIREKFDRLRRAVGELHSKMSRLLGEQSAVTTLSGGAGSGVDLALLGERACATAADAFAIGHCKISFKSAARTVPARTDARLVELALLAVLQNAAEACAARGGGVVDVSLSVDGQTAAFTASDDAGAPFDAELAQSFEPLAAVRRDGSRMGLGLFTARRFLERLGGGLSLKRENGRTTATLLVPLVPALPNIRNEESTWAGRRAAARKGAS